MLRPAGSLTGMSLGSGAWGGEGAKIVYAGSVGSFDCGKSRSTARPVGWSAWVGPPPGCSGLVAIVVALNWEARSGLSQPVTGGAGSLLVIQLGSLGSARGKPPRR